MIKEGFTELGLPVPHDHNLSSLLNILQSMVDVKIGDDVMLMASALQPYYISSRYHDDGEGELMDEINEESAEICIEYAKRIASFIEGYDRGR